MWAPAGSGKMYVASVGFSLSFLNVWTTVVSTIGPRTVTSIFESSIGRWHEQGQVTTTAWGFYCLARLQRGQGRLEAAAQTGARALAAIGDPGRRPRPAAGPALVGLAEVAYQREAVELRPTHHQHTLPLTMSPTISITSAR